MNVSHSMKIARGCPKKSKRTLESSNTSLDREHHQQERETSSLKPAFILICKWYTWSDQCCRSFQLKNSKRKIDNCLVSSTTGGMQPMTKCDGYQTTKQQNQKHSASFVDSSIKLKRSHLNCSKTAFSAKPCLCISECTSKKKRSSMLYLAEDSTDIFVSGWTLVWQNDGNAIWIVYWTCWTNNTKNELRKERERDWKSGLIVEFPIIMISDQNKSTHTHRPYPFSLGNTIFNVGYSYRMYVLLGYGDHHFHLQRWFFRVKLGNLWVGCQSMISMMKIIKIESLLVLRLYLSTDSSINMNVLLSEKKVIFLLAQTYFCILSNKEEAEP